MENSESKDFFRSVFYLEEGGKSELMNVLQFSFLSLIPIIILSKLIDKYVPKADDSKNNLELLAEVLIHVSALIVGVFFTIRMVTHFPTYSGIVYKEINELSVLLSVIVVVCMLDDILVEKINIIIGRLSDLWEGKSTVLLTKKVATQIAPKTNQQIIPTSNTTLLSNLPTTESQATSQGLSQQLPNYNNMYKDNSSGSSQPPATGDEYMNEPMAANDSFGGGLGSFSNW